MKQHKITKQKRRLNKLYALDSAEYSIHTDLGVTWDNAENVLLTAGYSQQKATKILMRCYKQFLEYQ